MAIVCVSRGSASGGKQLAQGLAERLGYEIVSREDIVQEASQFGASEKRLQETILRPLHFWERFSDERRRYLTFVQAALCEHCTRDRIIYHGNAGHLLLHGISHVLCIRLIAPMEFRVGVLAERDGIEAEEAARLIERVDTQRRNWTQFIYGVDWLDPNLYDLTINLQTMNVSTAVEIAAAATQRPEFEPTPASTQAMADLLLASRVRAALAANPDTAAAHITVEADGGNVRLSGRVRPASMVASVLDEVDKVEGVKRIDRQELDAPDLTV